MPKRLGQFADLREGLARKMGVRGEGEDGGVDTPMHSMLKIVMKFVIM